MERGTTRQGRRRGSGGFVDHLALRVALHSWCMPRTRACRMNGGLLVMRFWESAGHSGSDMALGDPVAAE